VLDADLDGLRAMARTARGERLAFTKIAREKLSDIDSAAQKAGHPSGFAELAWFSAVARADFGVLKDFATDLARGLAGAEQGAQLAVAAYEAVDDAAAADLKQIERMLTDGDGLGPSAGARLPADAPKTDGLASDYLYAPPGVMRTNWNGLNRDQIKALILSAQPDVVDQLKDHWTALARAIDDTWPSLNDQMRSLHWYGQGGSAFRNALTRTIESAQRWHVGAAARATVYDAVADAIRAAQKALTAHLARAADNLRDLGLELASATSKEAQDKVRQRLSAAEQAADQQARVIAAKLSQAIVSTVDRWRPPERYRGLIGELADPFGLNPTGSGGAPPPTNLTLPGPTGVPPGGSPLPTVPPPRVPPPTLPPLPKLPPQPSLPPLPTSPPLPTPPTVRPPAPSLPGGPSSTGTIPGVLGREAPITLGRVPASPFDRGPLGSGLLTGRGPTVTRLAASDASLVDDIALRRQLTLGRLRSGDEVVPVAPPMAGKAVVGDRRTPPAAVDPEMKAGRAGHVLSGRTSDRWAGGADGAGQRPGIPRRVEAARPAPAQATRSPVRSDGAAAGTPDRRSSTSPRDLAAPGATTAVPTQVQEAHSHGR
jgi:hypothetical protein